MVGDEVVSLELESLLRQLAEAETAVRERTANDSDARGGPDSLLLRLAHRKLQQSEQMFRAVFDSALDGLLLADDCGTYVDANPAACELFGIARERLIGRSISEFTESGFDFAGAWGQFLRMGRLKGPFRLVRDDGEILELDFKATANILPGLHLSVLHDVTEQRRAELRFRALIEKSTDMVVLADSDSVITYVSPSVTATLGYPPEELVGRRGVEFVHPDDLKAAKERRLAIVDDPSLTSLMEVRVRHRDGSWRWVESTSRNLLGDPAVRSIISNFRDVTDRKRALEMQARLAAIVESSDDAIISTDLCDVITSWNRGAERLYGWSAREVIGRRLFSLFPIALGSEERAARERVRRGESVDHWHTRRSRKDGLAVDVALTMSLIRDGAGNCVGISTIGRDLSESKNAERQLARTEEQLRQSQKMEAVGVLAGGLAHDFNNLLSVILSYTTLVLEDDHLGDGLREDIEEVRRAGERATILVRQLLAFSRRQVLKPRVVDLEQVLFGMEKMLKHLLGEGVELFLRSCSSLGFVYVDPSQVEQIIMNLVVNAREAMPSGGMLSVELSNVEVEAGSSLDVAPGQYVALLVADNGVGMDATTRHRIFEPFFTTKEKGKGTGLGLSTVFGIVAQSQGHIRVESEPGQGTSFRVYLPRTEQPHKSSTLRPPAAEELDGSETVLLVEDDTQVRGMVQDILRRHGYHVLDAQNGGEALLVCEQFPRAIHLLLTDVVMPRMNGRELADRIASMRRETRTLFMSGHTEDSIIDRGALEAGIAFLQKPITPEALLLRVREVLDACPAG